MNKYVKEIFIAVALMVLAIVPVSSSAFSVFPQPNQGALDIPYFLNTIVTIVWWVFIAGIVIYFVLIGALFLSSQGNPEEAAKARKALIWGSVGVLVGILAFSILYIVGRAFSFF